MHTRGEIRLGAVEPRPFLLGAPRIAGHPQHLRIVRRKHPFPLGRARRTQQHALRHRRRAGRAQQAAILAQAKAQIDQSHVLRQQPVNRRGDLQGAGDTPLVEHLRHAKQRRGGTPADRLDHRTAMPQRVFAQVALGQAVFKQ
ncbi:hypothetical protein D3C86_1683900 [compost metagenome]